MAELDIPGPVVDDEDWSDDEFEGYVGEPDGQQEEGREGQGDDGQQESEGETGDRLGIGGECEVGEASNLPPYSHTPGCNCGICACAIRVKSAPGFQLHRQCGVG